jgi:hypothetical protein
VVVLKPFEPVLPRSPRRVMNRDAGRIAGAVRSVGPQTIIETG